MQPISFRHTVLLALLLVGCGGGGGGGENSIDETGSSAQEKVVFLAHEGLTFDSSRQVYYATVSSTDTTRASRVATIDRQGQILSTSQPVGSSPRAIAVSKDGSRLYIGLNGTGEVSQYALPGFTLLATISLPVLSSGQTHAEQISISPTDPNVFAVSLAYNSVSPRHAGVALVKDMLMQPVRTPGHTGSNRIAFGPTGDNVYGFNNESTEFGLRKLAVAADGLVQGLVTPVSGADFDWDLDVTGNLVVVAGRAFSADTLAPRGTVAGTSFHCVGVAAGTKLACFADEYGKLVVAETTYFTRVGEILFPETRETGAYKLVAGPSGQVAASAPASRRIYLIDGTVLR